MSGLEINLKNTRPRPNYLKPETETTNKRLRPRQDRDNKNRS